MVYRGYTAVIGNPVFKSLSPVMHKYWFQNCGIDSDYLAVNLSGNQGENLSQPKLFEEVLRLRDKGYLGFNVTIPYKEDIYELVNEHGELHDDAKQIKAVNTVHFDDDKIIGYNTDHYGFYQGVRELVQDNNWFEGKTVLLIGAGGAARGMLFGLLKSNVSCVYLVNRTYSKAHDLVEEMKNVDSNIKVQAIQFADVPDVLGEIDLLANSTAVGMEAGDSLNIDFSLVKKDAVIFDAVYYAEKTGLLKDAENMGIMNTVNGLSMLIHQGHKAFQIWHGRDVDCSAVHTGVKLVEIMRKQ